jgi:hypothetical protein
MLGLTARLRGRRLLGVPGPRSRLPTRYPTPTAAGATQRQHRGRGSAWTVAAAMRLATWSRRHWQLLSFVLKKTQSDSRRPALLNATTRAL